MIYGSLKILGTEHPFVDTPLVIVVYAVAAIVVVRFGLVALASGIFTADLLANVPLTTDFSAWYAAATLVPLLAVAALAVWGFHTALAGRPLLKEELFE